MLHLHKIDRKISEKTLPAFEGNMQVQFSVFVSKYEDTFFEMNRPFQRHKLS